MRIELTEKSLELKEELVKFVFRVYQETNGAYPALEWVKKKPSTNNFEEFKQVYEPFLEFRLRDEFDELYALRSEDGKIIGTVALVYNIEGKDVWWVPDPEYKGKGYGSKLLEFAVERLRKLGKEAYVITFPELEAYSYYLKKGFEKVMDYREFVVMKYKDEKG